MMMYNMDEIQVKNLTCYVQDNRKSSMLSMFYVVVKMYKMLGV